MSAQKSSKTAGKAPGKAAGASSVPVMQLKEHIVEIISDSGEGAQRCMKIALEQAGNPRIDYLNPHGTSTPVGDVGEIKALRRVFGEGAVPPVSSTKSLTGHSLGATGVHEAIYSLLMMQNGFITASASSGLICRFR